MASETPYSMSLCKVFTLRAISGAEFGDAY
jgi:hypothetical protein